MSNHFYYDYPFIMSNLTESEYSFIMGPSLLCYLLSINICTYKVVCI